MSIDVATDTMTQSDNLDVVVVGAGFAGMYALHKLRQLGLNVRVYEAGGGVGGTWYWNRYPGARCDAPSMNYCYSFSPDLLEDWHWSEVYAAQPEIERYANHVADRFELRADIRFNTRVTGATWQESTHRWNVTTEHGEQVSARFMFMCTGCYSAPVRPNIDGLDTFQGEIILTSQWPTSPIDLAGKRVGVIGTGSSGVQAISAMAAEPVEHLYVFQRSANFILPTNNGPTDLLKEREIKDRYAEIWGRLYYSGQGVDYGEVPPAEIGSMTQEEFEDYMRDAWPRGGPLIVLGIRDSLTDELANRRLADYVNGRMSGAVADPKMAELVTAKDQHWGTRRLVLESGYFDALNQDNVTLVDVSSNPVRLTADGASVADASYPLDTLVLATGFNTGTGPMTSMDVIGNRGVRIADKWSEDIGTYLGVTLTDFPNLFVIAGPGSPSIRSNMILSIEQHVDWATDLVSWMAEHEFVCANPTPEAEQAWTAHVAETAAETLLVRDDTPYLGANVVGKPRVYLCYVGGVGRFRRICEAVAANSYEGIVFTTSQGAEVSSARYWSGPPAMDDEPVGSTVI